MRAIVTALSALVIVGCNTIGQEPRDQTITTQNGLRIEYSSVSTPMEFFANGDFGIAVTLIDRGKVRSNPVFVIAKKDMSLDERMDAQRRLMKLFDVHRWPTKARRFATSPERTAYLDAFEDEAFAALIESALELEAAKTKAERAAALAAADKRIQGFLAREPESGK